MPRGGNHKLKTGTTVLQETLRKQMAVEMRLAGYTLEKIGQELGGLDRSRVHHLIDSVIREKREEISSQAEDLRALDIARIDRMIQGVWPKATTGNDYPAIDRVLRLMERRAKLLGLDAPTKIAPTSPDGETPYAPVMTDTERAARIASIMAKALQQSRDAAEVAIGITVSTEPAATKTE